MRTPMLASTSVRWAAVRINPDFRYTPEPDCPPFRVISAVAIHGALVSFRSAPSATIGANSVTDRQSANAKRALDPSRDGAWPFEAQFLLGDGRSVSPLARKSLPLW